MAVTPHVLGIYAAHPHPMFPGDLWYRDEDNDIAIALDRTGLADQCSKRPLNLDQAEPDEIDMAVAVGFPGEAIRGKPQPATPKRLGRTRPSAASHAWPDSSPWRTASAGWSETATCATGPTSRVSAALRAPTSPASCDCWTSPRTSRRPCCTSRPSRAAVSPSSTPTCSPSRRNHCGQRSARHGRVFLRTRLVGSRRTPTASPGSPRGS